MKVWMVAGGDGRDWRVQRVFLQRSCLNEDLNLAKDFHHYLSTRKAIVRDIVLN